MADATMTMLRASVESLGRGKLPEPAVLKFLLSKVEFDLGPGHCTGGHFLEAFPYYTAHQLATNLVCLACPARLSLTAEPSSSWALNAHGGSSGRFLQQTHAAVSHWRRRSRAVVQIASLAIGMPRD